MMMNRIKNPTPDEVGFVWNNNLKKRTPKEFN